MAVIIIATIVFGIFSAFYVDRAHRKTKLEKSQRELAEQKALNMETKNILFSTGLLGVSGSPREQLKIMDEYIKGQPNSVTGYVIKAYWYIGKHEFAKSLQLAQQAQKIDPNNRDVLEMLGLAYLYSGQNQEAKKIFDRLIDINPLDYNIYNHRAEYYSALNQIGLAEHDYQKALEISPDDFNARFNLGNLYEANGEFDKALECYNQILEQDPENTLTLIKRGNLYLLLHQNDLAEKDHTKAYLLGYNGELLSALILNLGGYAMNNKDFPRALAYFTRAIDLNPKFTLAISNRASILVAMGFDKEAIPDLQRAIELEPNFFTPLEVYSLILSSSSAKELRNADKAVELALKSCELTNYSNYPGVFALGRAYAEAGDFDQAIKFNEQAIELMKKSGFTFSGILEIKKISEFYRNHLRPPQTPRELWDIH